MNDLDINNQPKEVILWEEKNLTEPEKNYSNSNVLEPSVSMKNIKNEEMPKVSGDIGKVKFDNKKYKKEYSQRPENKEKHKISARNYARINRLRLNIAGKIWRDKNKEHCRKWQIENLKKNKYRVSKNAHDRHIKNRERNNQRNREYRKEYPEKSKEYRLKNKAKINNQLKIRKDTDINFRLKGNLRIRLNKAIKNNQKSGSAVRDLGCSIEYFKHYIAGKFITGMTWENYGRFGWHLDHIKPLSSFNLENREEFLKACHYTNYQPLWATTKIARAHGDMVSIGNLEKGDKITPSL